MSTFSHDIICEVVSRDHECLLRQAGAIIRTRIRFRDHPRLDEESTELLHEAILHALTPETRFDAERSSATAWIIGIMKNLVRNLAKRERRQRCRNASCTTLDQLPDGRDSELLHALEEIEDRMELERRIATCLTPTQRVALLRANSTDGLDRKQRKPRGAAERKALSRARRALMLAKPALQGASA